MVKRKKMERWFLGDTLRYFSGRPKEIVYFPNSSGEHLFF
jgi:hypothetical protein